MPGSKGEADLFAELQGKVATQKILAEIGVERQRQEDRFGEQNHPDGTSTMWTSSADIHRAGADKADKDGELTWRHILMEEFFEALAEVDPARLRTELIQVAAVAVNWVGAIDRRERKAA